MLPRRDDERPPVLQSASWPRRVLNTLNVVTARFSFDGAIAAGKPQPNRVPRWFDLSATAIFLLALPLYQIAINADCIVPFARGGTIAAALVVILMFSVARLRALPERHFLSHEWIFALALLWGMAIAIFQYYSDVHDPVRQQMLVRAMHAVVLNVAIYAFVRAWILDVYSCALVALSGVILGVLMLANSRQGDFVLMRPQVNPTAVVNYMGFAPWLLIGGVFSLAIASRLANKLCVFAWFSLLLFLNGARSEFTSYLTITFALVTATAIRVRNWKALALLVGLLVGAAICLPPVSDAAQMGRSARLLRVTEETSWKSRLTLTANAVETIRRNPILGNYGSYARDGGSIGLYAHNVLSAWVDLGFVGFILYAYLGIALICKSMCIWWRKPFCPYVKMSLLASFHLLIMSVFAKHHHYLFWGFAVGALSAAIIAGRGRH